MAMPVPTPIEGVNQDRNRKLIHVAAAVIEDAEGNIFLAKRPDDKHQGGLWEFPGGKVEPGESSQTALARELDEEVGIQVTQVEPLIQIPYHYPDKSVFLDVFRVTEFTGKAWGREGQEVRWVPVSELGRYAFPAANKPILNAVLLPERLLITPSCESALACVQGIETALGKHDLQWVMLRQKQLTESQFAGWAATLQKHQMMRNKLLTLNCSVTLANELQAQSVHLTSERLMALSNRDAFHGRFLGASCHTQEELNQAAALQCDYVTLSPLNHTETHPDSPPLGWEAAERLIFETPLPVLLLGGIKAVDLPRARTIGAQGIAAISAWWT
jgi:8-oxo-dGTP diphosphatase